ncbi:MAG: hypothetical protein OXM54_17870 [Acidimicrobiaceae bacterium]|nr:hypothetical protein [Acidimicrobiaceae bacterium]
MSSIGIEATCRIGIMHEDDSGTRPLTYDELCEFVSDLADYLIDDERTIDPVVSGDAGANELEIVFGLDRPIADSTTDVLVFDIVHDADRAVGAAWRHDSELERPRREAPSASTMLTRQSQHLEAAGDFVDA